MDAIFKRVSVRSYRDQPVEDEKIEKILRAAMAAPSAGNQQPWEYYVVKDRDTIEKLAKCSPYSGCAAKAPVVIVPCLRTKGLLFPELGEVDLSITTENILLEVVEQGLGGVWLAVAPFDDRIEKVDAALGLSDDLHAFALVPIGYPKKEKPQEDRYDETRIHTID